jgi:GH15 family glucan-1,4-alpha-glucosidase
VRAAPHTLHDYALLADGERGILVGPRGEFAWMCFPSWESEALFSSLIGGSGVYSVTPQEQYVWGGYYEPSSLIWRSRWVTEHGAIIECREALALPADRSRAILLRRLVGLSGHARVDVVCNPRSGFGRNPARDLSQDRGRWDFRTGEVHGCLAGADRAVPIADSEGGTALTMTLELEEGDQHDLVLVLSLDANGLEPVDTDAAWAATEASWHARVPGLDATIAPRDARLAYAVLTGLTSSSGGMVAAATMSLPERARAGRNYDYRYAWIRDQCLAGQAVAKVGPCALLDGSVSFVRDRLLEDGPDLRPAYTVSGGPVPDERRLDLPGYPGGKDITGNQANAQFQLDGFGEALLLFAAAAGHDQLDADGRRAAEVAADAIGTRWHEEDSGIWELDPDEWTHSRLICSAGLRAMSSYAAEGLAAQWLALAEAMTSDMAARAVHPTGRWQRSPSDTRVDAALLLPSIRGAVPPEDERSRATLAAVEAELTDDGFVYRYRPDERPLGQAEGAFLMCGFATSLAWWQQGDEVKALRRFERNRSACGPPGLLSEEYDVTQRQLRGNMPQAFVHALLLECAATLAG